MCKDESRDRDTNRKARRERIVDGILGFWTLLRFLFGRPI